MTARRWGRALVALAFIPSLLLLASASRAASGWTMANGGTSQTLTNGAANTVTFDTAQIDAGGSVIDLANDRFVLPRSGFYLVTVVWMWETTVPISSTLGVARNGSLAASYARQSAAAIAHGTLAGSFAISGSAGDFITVIANPGAVTGVTSRGNGAASLRTSATLIELDIVPTAGPTASPGPGETPVTIEAFAGTAAETIEAVKWAVGAGVVLMALLLSALVVVAGLRR